MFKFLFLAIVFILTVALAKTVQSVTAKELKRQARTGKNRKASSIYKMSAYGPSLTIFLWLVGTASFTGLLVIAADWTWWYAWLLSLLVVWWLYLSSPVSAESGWMHAVTVFLSPYVAWLISYLHPIFSRIARLLFRGNSGSSLNKLYEKEDLLDLIKQQNDYLHNRIPETDLKIVFGALSFGDKTVGSIMTPRRKVKLVAASDSIGPLLMDELHGSGFSRFPVVKEITKTANPEVVGTLYLKDVFEHSGSGRVSDLMRREVFFVNEANNLRQALSGFIKNQHHLAVVVNNFEEIAGVLSLEDVVEQILGQKINDEFDQHEDLRAATAKEAEDRKQQRHQNQKDLV